MAKIADTCRCAFCMGLKARPVLFEDANVIDEDDLDLASLPVAASNDNDGVRAGGLRFRPMRSDRMRLDRMRRADFAVEHRLGYDRDRTVVWARL